MLKRIRVGLGGTDYGTSAINHSIALAIAHDAEVTGVSIVDQGRFAMENSKQLPSLAGKPGCLRNAGA